MDGSASPAQKLKLDSDTGVEELAAILGTTYSKIKYFFYPKVSSNFYSEFKIAKKGGGFRQILAPNKQLKTLQLRISRQLSDLYKPSSSVKGFLEKTSIADNARPHVKRKFVLNLDLENFFPTITFARVRGLLIAKPYSLQPATASVIAHLVTVNGRLPQGAPSSPVISNMMCASLDHELRILAMKHKASYTRYADDITFSFYCPLQYISTDFVKLKYGVQGASHHECTVGDKLSEVINDKGFKINHAKFRLQRWDEKQVVTGLVVNKKVNLDRRYIRKTSAQIHSVETFGLDSANEIYKSKNPETETAIEAHIHGRLLYMHQVLGAESQVYRRLAVRFNNLNVQYKAPVVKAEEPVQISSPKYSKSIVSKCWVLEIPEYSIQGTGFMLENNVMVTCAHVFDHILDPEVDDQQAGIELLGTNKVTIEKCVAYRVNSKNKKYTAEVVYRDTHRDLAILKFSDSNEKFEFFRLEEDLEPAVGDKVSVLGFPNYKLSATEVSRFWAYVTTRYVGSMVQYADIDKVMYSGNSGGPVLNLNHHVVGVVKRGAANNPEGSNTFICTSEVVKVLHAYNQNLIAAQVMEPA